MDPAGHNTRAGRRGHEPCFDAWSSLAQRLSGFRRPSTLDGEPLLEHLDCNSNSTPLSYSCSSAFLARDRYQSMKRIMNGSP